MVTNILLGLVIFLLAVLIYLSLAKRAKDAKQLEVILSNAWVNLGIDEKVGRLEGYADDIRQDYRELEKLLRAPASRGSLGEIGLEKILADHLPPAVYGIRRKILNGKTPKTRRPV